MKIIFMGTPAFAIPTLQALIDSRYTVEAVVTQPDRPCGRGGKVQPPPIKILAATNNIPVFQPKKLNSDETCIKRLKELNSTIILVVAYGQILSEEILEIPLHGCINLHASLLPKYRGAAPINWAIMNREEKSGVTIMQIDKGMDTGDMLYRQEVRLHPSDNAMILHDTLSDVGAQAILAVLEKAEQETLIPEAQDDSQSTYAPRLKKEDGCITWINDAEQIVGQIKGLVPWPCAYTYLKGEMIKLWDAKAVTMQHNKCPGEISIINRDLLEVATGKGSIRVTEIQRQGRRKMPVKDFLQGKKIKSGFFFDSNEKIK